MRRIPQLVLSTLSMFLAMLGHAANGAVRGPWQYQYQNENAREEFRSFEQFLSGHPWIAKKLKGKPSLANDKDFLNDNSELPHFLTAHPNVQSALRADPVGFMQRVRDFEVYGAYYRNGAMRGQLAEFDQFLANHPWIAKKLREKPSLANDRDFLHDNPELGDYLGAHPVLQQEFRSNPRGVMNRASAGTY